MAMRPTSATFLKQLRAGVVLQVPSSTALVQRPPRVRAAPVAALLLSKQSWRALATDAGSSSSSAGAAADGESQSKSKDEKEPMSWWRFGMHLGGGIVGLVFLYYFRKSGYSIHGTELLLLERIRQMPFYPPPEPPEAEANSSLEAGALPREFVAAFAEWFIATDLRQGEGVTRDDVLELLSELSFSEDDKACKAFINEGEGSFEEARRLSGCGLQEALSLLETLAVPADERDTLTGAAKGNIIRSRLGQQETDILRRKCTGVQAVTSAASALAQNMTAPFDAPRFDESAATSSASSLPPFPPSPGRSVPASQPAAPATISESGTLDEADQDKLEVARLTREETKIMAQLERRGCLSPAEEERLRVIRQDLAVTRARAAA